MTDTLGPGGQTQCPAQGTGRLIIVCGLPGSGKTTRALQLERQLRGIRFCPDEWMPDLGYGLWDGAARGQIEALQWRLAQNLLTLGHTVVIEWGTWGKPERDTLREGARALGAAVELYFLDAPLDVLLDRIRRRNAESPPVTPADLARWDSQFQRPTPEEMALFDAVRSILP